MKHTRKTVESASDVINIVEVPQIQYTDRVVDIRVCVEDGPGRLVCSRSLRRQN